MLPLRVLQAPENLRLHLLIHGMHDLFSAHGQLFSLFSHSVFQKLNSRVYSHTGLDR